MPVTGSGYACLSGRLSILLFVVLMETSISQWQPEREFKPGPPPLLRLTPFSNAIGSVCLLSHHHWQASTGSVPSPARRSSYYRYGSPALELVPLN